MAILVERDNIGIFGSMNAGKSSVMNLITQQETSIVDAAPGTTADTKTALIEIHGLGPVRIFDTAGIDEKSELGLKKKKKAENDLKECDLVLVVIDPSRETFKTENELIIKARENGKQIIIIYNLFNNNYVSGIGNVISRIPLIKFYRQIEISAINIQDRQKLIDFIIANYEPKTKKIELLPFLKPNEFYVLNIPMDDETPPGRYLRPQAMVEEYITRHWAYPVSYRMDLNKARSKDIKTVNDEKDRFMQLISGLGKLPHCIITDSQAMDVVSKWCPPNILLTTFSITMINFMSKGKLAKFVEGTKTIDLLRKGDKVLIVEACNHSRIGEDIGTVQIPGYLNKYFKDIVVEHNFGREFYENNELEKYKLIIHCGGCMISHQELSARLRDLDKIGVPYTNYGLFLSYIQGKEVFDRVLKPWDGGIK